MRRRLAVVDVDRCVGCQVCMFACVRRTGAAGLAEARIHVRSDGGIERGFVVIVCRACPEPQCAKVCPTDALERREDGGVRLASERCIGCGNCAEACPFGAVFWDEGSQKPLICVYCGVCARWCPHGVLALEEREEASHAG
ncbi:MAG: 4Fe-4S dicluster domain-containing protein [bacterium]